MLDIIVYRNVDYCLRCMDYVEATFQFEQIFILILLRSSSVYAESRASIPRQILI
jgi:hypothetical protein